MDLHHRGFEASGCLIFSAGVALRVWLIIWVGWFWWDITGILLVSKDRGGFFPGPFRLGYVGSSRLLLQFLWSLLALVFRVPGPRSVRGFGRAFLLLYVGTSLLVFV